MILTCLQVSGPAYAQFQNLGAEVTDERVIVNSRSHWEHWSLPRHAVTITDDTVVPRYFRERFNVMEDHATYTHTIEEPAWDTRDRFKYHKGSGALTAVPNVGRRIATKTNGEMRLRQDLTMEKYLDANLFKYPDNDTHLLLDGELFVIVDTAMTSAKEGVLALENVRTGRATDLNFSTKDKHVVPVYSYFARPGISRTGSNRPEAAHLFDGKMDTYWEPGAGDPLEAWWLEIDLGRTVLVDEIVLRFADADLGDPFRQFRILASPTRDFVDDDEQLIEFLVVAGTTRPNDGQREFRLPITDDLGTDPDWTGRVIETVRIVVTESRGGQHTRLYGDNTLEQWEQMDPADRGDVVYYVTPEGGFEEPVSREQYDSLAQARQGRKEYYRRERPRLAEIEVWGLGDDIGPQILVGGGSISTFGEGAGSPALAFDGSHDTFFTHATPSESLPELGTLTVDLGATFWLDSVRMISKEPLPGYTHRVSNGSRDSSGRPKWSRLSPVSRETNTNDQLNQTVDTFAAAPRARLFESRVFRIFERGWSWNIREYQLLTRPSTSVIDGICLF